MTEPTTPPLIDRAVLDDLFDSIGDDGARTVIELFIVESSRYLAAIATAVGQPDAATSRNRARLAAHGFKSGAGQIGAAAAAAAAAEVEHAAAVGSADLPQAAAALVQCTAETVRALNDLLDRARKAEQ